MLHLLLPVLIIVCGGIGFFASFLATRGRTKEFAVMRCLGMKQCKIFGLVMGELSILAFTGAFFGIAGGILLEGEIQTSALLHAALMTGIFFTRFRGCSTSDHKHKCYESHEGGGLNMNILTSKQVTYEYRNAVQTVRAVNGVSCTFSTGACLCHCRAFRQREDYISIVACRTGCADLRHDRIRRRIHGENEP